MVVSAYFAKPGTSDHVRIELHLSELEQTKRKQFKFINIWAYHHKFIDIIREGEEVLIEGHTTYKIFVKVKNMKRAFRKPHMEFSYGLTDKIKTIAATLMHYQKYM